MKLSVILPVYNMEKYLHRCLDSLLAQDIPKDVFEIIVVNDESIDKSLAIAQSYAAKHENIVICNKKNGGAGAARNAGRKLANGKYIHFVDPDDYIAKNVYKTLLDFAENKQLDILTFGFIKTKSTTLSMPNSATNEIPLEDIPIMDGITYIAQHNYRNTVWWYLINNEFLSKTGLQFIEGKWMEDSILTPQLFMNAKRMAKMPLDVYRYMIIPNSAMTSKEPGHYNKLIFDIENATFVFDDILKNIPNEGEMYIDCKNRLKTRQQSFVFFLLVRLMKSNLPTKHISEMLSGFKKIKAYPLDNFVGKDFNGLGYSFMTFIFNKEKLMYPFMRLFRFFYRTVMKLVAR